MTWTQIKALWLELMEEEREKLAILCSVVQVAVGAGTGGIKADRFMKYLEDLRGAPVDSGKSVQAMRKAGLITEG